MTNILLLLNMVVSLGIALFLILKFIKPNTHPHLKNVFFLFFLIGLVFLLSSIIFSSWFFGIVSYGFTDILFIYSILTFFEAFLLLLIVYKIRKSKKIFYLLFIYIIFILSSLIGLNFSNFLLLSSLLLIMILFILLISAPNFNRIAKFAIFYSSLSLLLQILLLFENKFSPIVILISNLSFFAFLFFFMKDIKRFPPFDFNEPPRIKKGKYIFDFLRYFVFIVILTNFIFIGVLAIHEGGHFFMSKLNPNCSLERIVYEGNLPHTEILCEGSNGSMNLVIFGGIFLPVIVALLFFFGGGTFMKEISLLILGFDILISYKDFLDLGFSQGISTFFSVFGGIILFLAIGILAKSRTIEEEFIHLSES